MASMRQKFVYAPTYTESSFGLELPLDCSRIGLNSTRDFDPSVVKNGVYGTWHCLFERNLTQEKWEEEEGDSDDLQTIRAAIVGVILGFISVATTVGNILVLIAIFANTFFRNTTHYFIANLAVADLLVGVTVLPFSASLEVLDYWAFGQVLCDVWAAADVLCCTASIFSLCVISVDRYIGVTRPLQHGTIISETRAAYIIVLIWVASFAISVAPLFGWKEPPSDDPGVCDVTKQTGYVLFSVSGSFYIPLVVILVVYFRVYREATNQSLILEGGMMIARSGDIALRIHFGRTDLSVPMGTRTGTRRHRTRAGGVGVGGGRGSRDPAAAVATSPLQSPSSPSLGFLPRRRRRRLLQQEKHQQSQTTTPSGTPNNKSLANKIAKFNREKKAAKTLGIVVGVFIGCWLPFFFVLPLEALCDHCVVPVWLFKVIFWLGYCNSLMNPVIYACSSREFQRAFLRILRCSKLRRQEPQFLRQTFLALQSVHATSASIATNFNHSSRRLAVGVAHGAPTFVRSNSSPTSPTTDVKNDIPMVRIH